MSSEFAEESFGATTFRTQLSGISDIIVTYRTDYVQRALGCAFGLVSKPRTSEKKALRRLGSPASHGGRDCFSRHVGPEELHLLPPRLGIESRLSPHQHVHMCVALVWQTAVVQQYKLVLTTAVLLASKKKWTWLATLLAPSSVARPPTSF